MRSIVATIFLSLDGVMQAPARPDEDQRGGFEYGGWAAPYNDAVMASEMGKAMAQGRGGPMLLGRRTYQDFYRVWPSRSGDPASEQLNQARKYVASTTLHEPLPWVNSTLLKGDAVEAVAELKRQPGQDIAVLGSGQFLQSLMRRGLVDRYVLLIYPLVLGSGRRLFPDGGPHAPLKLRTSVTTTTGVIIATYESAAAPDTEAPAG